MGGLDDRRQDRRVSMSKNQGTPRADKIQVAETVGVEDMLTGAAGDEEAAAA